MAVPLAHSGACLIAIHHRGHRETCCVERPTREPSAPAPPPV
jgi:hypothetical protein